MKKTHFENGKRPSKEEESIITMTIGMVCAWAEMHEYEKDDALDMIIAWLATMRKYSTFSQYRAAAASYIRAQDAEEMAAMIWDTLEENRECNLPFPDYKLRLAHGGMLFDSRESLEGLLGKTLTEE